MLSFLIWNINNLSLTLIFFHSSFKFVIIIQITILTLSFGVNKSIGVRTGIGITVPAIFMIAMIAHTLFKIYVFYLLLHNALSFYVDISLSPLSFSLIESHFPFTLKMIYQSYLVIIIWNYLIKSSFIIFMFP